MESVCMSRPPTLRSLVGKWAIRKLRLRPLLKKEAERLDLKVVGGEHLSRVRGGMVLFVDGDGLPAVAAVNKAFGKRKFRIVESAAEKTDTGALLGRFGLLLEYATEESLDSAAKYYFRRDVSLVFADGDEERAARCAFNHGLPIVPCALASQPTGGETDFATLLVMPPIYGKEGETEKDLRLRIVGSVNKGRREFEDCVGVLPHESEA